MESCGTTDEKYARCSAISISTGFQVNKFQKCSEIWLKESYKISPMSLNASENSLH